MPQTDLIGTKEAAKLLKVSPQQVGNLIRDKVLHAELIAGTYLIRRSDLAKVPKVRKPTGRPKVTK